MSDILIHADGRIIPATLHVGMPVSFTHPKYGRVFNAPLISDKGPSIMADVEYVGGWTGRRLKKERVIVLQRLLGRKNDYTVAAGIHGLAWKEAGQ